MNDATEKGVSEEDVKATDPREDLVNSILAKNDEDRKEYETYMDPEKESDKEPDEEPAGESTPEDEKPKEQEEEELVKIVVDGEEKEVPLSEILDAGKRTYQKESAADKRLEEATKLLNEAKAQKPPEKDAEKEPESKFIVPKDIVQAINYGTDEEAEKAVQQLIDMGSTRESVTPEKVEKIASDIVSKKNKEQYIFTRFSKPKEEGGFNDLLEDPYLHKMAEDKVNELLLNGEKNDWETYEKAGNEVRKWVEKFKGPQEKVTFENKKEKKKTIDNVKGANAVKSEINKDEKPKSASDVIKEIQERRPGGGG